MTLLPRASLANKVAFTVLPVGLGLAMLFAWAGQQLAQQREVQRQQEYTTQLLDTVESTVRIACFTGDEGLAADIGKGLLSNRTVYGVRIAADDKVLVSSYKGTSAFAADTAYQVRRPIVSPFDANQVVGEVMLVADKDVIEASAGNAAKLFAQVLSLLVMLVSLFVAIVVYGVVVRPIRRFARGMQDVSGVFEQPLSVPKGHEHNEIGFLARTFNTLMGHVASMLRQEQSMREQMSDSEQRYRTLAENSPDLIVRHDLTYRVLYANPSYLRLMGLDESYFAYSVGSQGASWRPSMPLHHFQAHLDRVVETGQPVTVLWEWSGDDGAPVHHEMQIVPEYDGEGRAIGTLTMGRDITARLEAERKLHHQASHDELTGLPNRAWFQARLQQAIAQSRRDEHEMALLFVDLDNFKAINDTLGHATGDELLRLLARRMQATLRQGDTVARLGGDEFVVLLERCPPRHVLHQVVQKLVHAVAEGCQLNGHQLFPSASVGVAICPHDGHDVDTLMRNADMAMYSAKAAGRQGYRFYAADMNEGVQDWLQVSSDLRLALERGEFELHFQPQASVPDGRLVGMEALIRWNHPQKGLMAPDKFIPVAEQSGVIAAIDMWVLEASCRQMRQWLDAGLRPCRMAVNLSASPKRGQDFAEQVLGILRRQRLSPTCLELEITETSLMTQMHETIQAFWTLRDHGVTVAVDDFGTGYSSLSYLRRLPVDTLKIDRSFIDEIESDPNDQEITRAIVAMANALGLDVVAEGVERDSQLDALKAMNCPQYQGFGLSRPLGVADMTAWLGKQAGQRARRDWEGEASWAA